MPRGPKASAAAKIGLNIAYSSWHGFLSYPWSGRITHPAARSGAFFVVHSQASCAHAEAFPSKKSGLHKQRGADGIERGLRDGDTYRAQLLGE
jgi:hypothetical protein